ncbi:uncharacterized protein LOC110281544 [Arachis duranensis]|uniref:Uncharacterized protein LOC110281544 n=1 Tax=Arachis duranensis TaxID=130453 RepID=A0A6P5NTG8_ARADU|nr:uncharacterized protein LOC110281544 [Arachis duranensis]
MGKSWKDTRLRLYDDYYEPTLSTEENIENRSPGIDRDHWRWYLDYRAKPETKEKCKKNALNRSKQLYTHIGGSKSLARRREEESEQEGRIVSRGELWIKVHKRSDGSYINDETREIGERLLEIEQEHESSRVLSQNDSLAQVFGREKPGRVRGVGLGPTPSQLFGTNLRPSVNRVLEEETQRKLNELQTELEAEKLKRKAMEDEAAADKKRIKSSESLNVNFAAVILTNAAKYVFSGGYTSGCWKPPLNSVPALITRAVIIAAGKLFCGGLKSPLKGEKSAANLRLCCSD